MKLPNIRRKPLYTVTEVNQYIRIYQDMEDTKENEATRKVMREVIEHMNQRILKEGKR